MVGQLYFYSTRHDEALDMFVRIDCGALSTADQDAYMYMRGKSELLEGSLDSALHFLSRSLAVDSTNIHVVRAYADASYESEDYHTALSFYRSAIQIDSLDYYSVLYSALSCLWLDADCYGDFYSRAFEMESNSYLHVVACMKYLRKGDLVNAAKELESARTLNPDVDVLADIAALGSLLEWRNSKVPGDQSLDGIPSNVKGDFRISKYLGNMPSKVSHE